MDTSHLVALHESLSRNRQWLSEAQSDHQRANFQRCIDSKRREIDAEMRFLGMPLDSELDEVSDEDLLRELGQ